MAHRVGALGHTERCHRPQIIREVGARPTVLEAPFVHGAEETADEGADLDGAVNGALWASVTGAVPQGSPR